MRNQRTLILALSTAVVLFLSNILNVTVSTNRFNTSYPASVCSPNTTGLTTAISLTSPKTLVRKTGTSSMQTSQVGFRRFAVAAQSAVLEAGSVTPVAWQVRTGVWAGAVPCSAPVASQWFVGATADITSKGSLNVVNSGLGRALVEIQVFTENGSITPRTISLKANTFTSLSLASLAPGSKQIAIHILPRSGRINGFVIDERGKGLRALGGDLVSPGIAPSKQIYIPAIPLQPKVKNAPAQQLRLLAPGDADANISVEVISGDGRFTPVGFNEILLKKGQVMNFSLSPSVSSSVYGIRIESDEPIVAGVLANVGKDFVWSSSVPPLSPFTIAMTGMSPLLVFIGDSINVDLELGSAGGKKIRKNIQGSDIAFWRVPDNARNLTFVRVSANTYGSALQASVNGFGSIPLIAGSVLTKSAIPTANIRVLNP